MTDTIFAVSSGAPPAAIAIVRVSGPEAERVVRTMAGLKPEPRCATLRGLRDPANGLLLDRALVLWFPAPNSATGEDIIEFHVHGGRAVVAAIETAIGAIPGCRAAAPGEFTRRALASGRIDLAEAEGLGDLLQAETEAQRRAAMASAEGEVSRRVAGWNAELLDVSARIEALLDFADEDDLPDEAPMVGAIRTALTALHADIVSVLANPPAERLRDGIRVVLAGRPNAGKSTLLNRLIERDAAIVSPIAGTTRDRIEAPVRRNGIDYLLIDTAGMTDMTDDPIERIGVERARRALDEADIVLLLDDTPIPDPPHVIRVRPKSDGTDLSQNADGRLAVSALTGDGVASLWAAIDAAARALLPRLDRLILNRRQRALCGEAAEAIDRAIADADLLGAAEWCRLARSSFDRITGAADTDAMLDSLFSRFCIGK